MKIECDPAKRQRILEARGLDMMAAEQVFEGEILTFTDDRHDYGETRYISVGFLDGRMVFMAWTPRGETRRMISMRKANEREQEKYGPFFHAG